MLKIASTYVFTFQIPITICTHYELPNADDSVLGVDEGEYI